MEVEPSSLELAVSDFPAASAGQVSSLSRCKWPAHQPWSATVTATAPRRQRSGLGCAASGHPRMLRNAETPRLASGGQARGLADSRIEFQWQSTHRPATLRLLIAGGLSISLARRGPTITELCQGAASRNLSLTGESNQQYQRLYEFSGPASNSVPEVGEIR
jgi:hypothetical protein